MEVGIGSAQKGLHEAHVIQIGLTRKGLFNITNAKF